MHPFLPPFKRQHTLPLGNVFTGTRFKEIISMIIMYLKTPSLSYVEKMFKATKKSTGGIHKRNTIHLH